MCGFCSAWPLLAYLTRRIQAYYAHMKTQMADGPKTELVGVSQRMQQSMVVSSASVSCGVGDCRDNALNAEPRSIADDTRSSERRDAVQMVSSTAGLLSAIAKLKGAF